MFSLYFRSFSGFLHVFSDKMEKKICRERNVDYLCNPKRKVRADGAKSTDETDRKYFEICDLFRGEFEKNERLTMRCLTMKSPESTLKFVIYFVVSSRRTSEDGWSYLTVMTD